MHGLRETAPPGPYFPFHRDETYPRTLCVNFKRLEYRTLQKYCKLHAINVRPDCTQSELAVAAARHFQEAPSVDEEGVMVSFLKQVIVPDKPFRPTIDLALARMGSLSVDNGELGGGGRGVMPNAVMHDLNSNSNNIDMDDHGHMHGGDDGVIEEGEGEMMAAGGGGGPQRERDHSGGRGVHGNHGYGGRHGHPSSVVGAGGGMGYDEKPRGDWSRVPIRDGPSAGRGYGHEYEYGGPRHQVSSSWDHLQDGPGGEMMSKLGKRSGNGSSSARSRNGRGSSGSAPGHGSVPVMTSSSDRGMSMPGVGEDGKGRRQKNNDRGVGSGVDASSSVNVKPPPGKKSRKGSVGWRAKNGEQVAVRDDRGEEPGAWILARVLKYVPETHQYELKDDDDKEGIGMLTAPRSLVIRLEDNTKGVQRGERVLAVFPDTTSFYLGTVHRVVKPIPGLERRIEVKFNDDADSNGRTPARPLPARYVIPLPDGFEEDDSKPAEMDDDDEQPAHGGGGGGRGAGEEDADEPMGGEEDGGGSTSIPYVEMIRTALLKLPGRQGNLPTVCAYIEEHFHERLNWTSESTLRRTPAWKASVRRTLAHHPSFCHAGTPERNVYTLAE